MLGKADDVSWRLWGKCVGQAVQRWSKVKGWGLGLGLVWVEIVGYKIRVHC